MRTVTRPDLIPLRPKLGCYRFVSSAKFRACRIRKIFRSHRLPDYVHGHEEPECSPSPFTTRWPEICLPLRKRPRRTTPGLDYAPIITRSMPLYQDVPEGLESRLGGCIIYSQLDDARHDRALLRAQVNMLYRDRPFHRRTAILMEEEARLSRAAWAQSMDACDQVRSEGISLRTTVMHQPVRRSDELPASSRRGTDDDFRSAESRLSETETVSGGTKDSEEPQDSDDRASETAGTC
ncbi:hypothetical protein Tco_0237701 [Tanacetum coccineum]